MALVMQEQVELLAWICEENIEGLQVVKFFVVFPSMFTFEHGARRRARFRSYIDRHAVTPGSRSDSWYQQNTRSKIME